MKTFYEVLDQMKAEINADIAAGQVPATVKSFSELHDYVDANEYGGFCDESFNIEYEAAHGGALNMSYFVNDAQNAINSWLEAGRG